MLASNTQQETYARDVCPNGVLWLLHLYALVMCHPGSYYVVPGTFSDESHVMESWVVREACRAWVVPMQDPRNRGDV